MAIVMKMEMPGGTAEFYDSICAKIDFPEQIPDGLISHCAFPTETGWTVCDIWQSEQALTEFNESRLYAAMAQTAEEFGFDPSTTAAQVFPAHSAVAVETSPVHA